MITPPLKLGFMASRNGSSARAIIKAIEAGELDAEARLMVSNNSTAPALLFASAHGVPTRCITTKADPVAADERLMKAMEEAGVELIVLSGYLRQLGPKTLERYAGRVLNIHPGPIPLFGGPGMYGRRVHEAVIESGTTASAITVHVVDEEYDHGPPVAARAVAVKPGDTPETLEARVTALEPTYFVEVLRRIAKGQLRLPRRSEQ